MSRLHKKCFFASAGFHLLLLLILLIGPAFIAADKADEMQILDFVPAMTIDQAFADGGNPNARPPAPQPQPPAPQPQPQPAPPKAPERVVEPPSVKEAKPDPDSLEAEAKPRRPNISTRPIVRNRDNRTPPKNNTTASSDAQARADARRRDEARNALRSLRNDLSSTTTVEMPGPGGGGPTYANYKTVLASIYYHAWSVPDGADTDAATAVATVTVRRDGTVISARLKRGSGNVVVDASVQSTLDNVRFIAPFPADSKDTERTFTINFNLKTKQGIG